MLTFSLKPHMGSVHVIHKYTFLCDLSKVEGDVPMMMDGRLGLRRREVHNG